MKIINVSLKEIAVGSFTAHDESVLLNLVYHDPNQNILKKTIIVGKNDSIISELLKDIKKQEQLKHFEFDGERFMDTYVHVIIENEGTAKKELSDFLNSVSSKIQEIKNKKESDDYLTLIGSLLRLKQSLS